MQNGIVHRLDETFQPLRLSLQGEAVRFERGNRIEIRAAEHGFDIFQPEIQFTVEQDLLELKQRLVAIFAIAVTFTLIVMFDAQGVRLNAGRQAEILNKMLEDIYWKKKLDEDKLKELIGHTPVEVWAGMFLGIMVSLLFYR